jgi:hypothetical protein
MILFVPYSSKLTYPRPFGLKPFHTATYFLSRRPSHSINNFTPYFLLHGSHPCYDHLRIFGCLCFPNLYTTTPHKLSPRSMRCVFAGYALEHKGYRCFDLSTCQVIISRHVVFDEDIFPYEPPTPAPTNNPPHRILHIVSHLP